MSTVGNVAGAQPAESAAAVSEPNMQNWDSAKADAQAASDAKSLDDLAGAIGSTVMTPLIMKALTAGQDDE